MPALKARVTDTVNLLSATQRAQLEEELAAIEQAKGSQVAVLVVATTAPEEIEPYAVRVFETWKLGRGVVAGKRIDDGVLIVVARDDRRMRIEVGYGLEGAIPDALAKRIVAESMGPRFAKGDWYGGLHAGVVDVARLIAGEELPPPQRRRDVDVDLPNDWAQAFITVIVIWLVVRAVLGRFLGSLAGGVGAGVVATTMGASIVVALALGLVTRLVENPVDAAMQTAREIASRSPEAIRAGKLLLNEAWHGTENAGLELEADLQKGLLGRPNQVEAVMANLQNRPPKFSNPA